MSLCGHELFLYSVEALDLKNLDLRNLENFELVYFLEAELFSKFRGWAII